MKQKTKQFLSLALALLLMLSLAACSGGGSGDNGGTGSGTHGGGVSTAPPAGSQSVESNQSDSTNDGGDATAAPSGGSGDVSTSGSASGGLFDWIKSKQYTYEYTTYDDDGRIIEGTAMVDGEDMCSIVQVTFEGVTNDPVRTVIKDGVTFMIIDSEKMYFNMGSFGSDVTEEFGGSEFFPEGLAKLGEGEEEIDGKVLRYEAYEQETLGIFSTLKLFYDGGTLYGYTVEGELENPEILGGGTVEFKSTTIIRNAKNSVDKSMFEISADYTEQSMTGD